MKFLTQKILGLHLPTWLAAGVLLAWGWYCMQAPNPTRPSTRGWPMISKIERPGKYDPSLGMYARLRSIAAEETGRTLNFVFWAVIALPTVALVEFLPQRLRQSTNLHPIAATLTFAVATLGAVGFALTARTFPSAWPWFFNVAQSQPIDQSPWWVQAPVYVGCASVGCWLTLAVLSNIPGESDLRALVYSPPKPSRWRWHGANLLTWAWATGFIVLVSRLQHIRGDFSMAEIYGYPMQSVENELGFWTRTQSWSLNASGLAINVAFLVIVTLASAYVVEKSLRHWFKTHHVSLSALGWVVSVVGVTLGLVHQGYWSIARKIFKFIGTGPNVYLDDLPWHDQAGLYFAMGCTLYVVLYAASRFALASAGRIRAWLAAFRGGSHRPLA